VAHFYSKGDQFLFWLLTPTILWALRGECVTYSCLASLYSRNCWVLCSLCRLSIPDYGYSVQWNEMMMMIMVNGEVERNGSKSPRSISKYYPEIHVELLRKTSQYMGFYHCLSTLWSSEPCFSDIRKALTQ